MTIAKTMTAAVLGLAAMITPAMAANVCANATDMAAFRTAAVQQQLMVAALTCRDVEAYNRFVLAYQPELQKSDADLKSYFIRRGNEAEYDTFKTKLANLSSLSDIANGPAYCANAAAAFDMALKSRQALSSFVADQRLMIAMPKQTMCAETRPEPVSEAAAAKMPVRVAEAKPLARPEPVRVALAAAKPQSVTQTQSVPGVPAHALPASPYGAQDEAPPQPVYQRDENYSDHDLAPLPPRPERPRSASREEDYYAARYAAIWRERGYRAPAPDDRDDYWGR